jgi:hypothetical protein
MPSRPAPMGKVPETKEDAKLQAKASSVEAVEEQAQEEAEVDVDESDVEALQEEQKIPYQRFKAKVDETKTLKSQLAEAESRYKQALLEKETLQSIRGTPKDPEPEDVIDVSIHDPQVSKLQRDIEALRSELNSVKGETSGDRLKSQLNELKAKYPKANVLAALGIKKHDPSANLEEIMETLHTSVTQEVESSLKNIIEKKKLKNKQTFPTQEGGFKLKDSEKPKTVKEASALAKRLFGR